MRRTAWIAAVLLAIALVTVLGIWLVGPPAPGSAVPDEPITPEESTPPEAPTDAQREQIVRLDGYESGVWPYLSAAPRFQPRSPINVVVRGDTDRVIRILQSDTDTEWQETPPDEQEAREDDYSASDLRVNGTSIAWGQTGGGARYAYVHDGESGEWVRETAHLDDGDYYGKRVHVRLYESPAPDEPWVAMQAHSEHFDWFTLRHAVDGSQAAQVHVETDLMDHPAVDDVLRRQLGNARGSDADGWATIVEMALLLPLLVVGSTVLEQLWRSRLAPVDRRRLRLLRDHLSLRQAALAAAIVGLLLGVRVGGITLERSDLSLTMHQIAGLLYPFVALGIPLSTYLISRTVERRIDAAVTASLAMAAGILLDYSYVGIGVIPIDILLHRVGVILAIGLIAGGAARRATRDARLNELAVSGILLWGALLLATLFEYV